MLDAKILAQLRELKALAEQTKAELGQPRRKRRRSSIRGLPIKLVEKAVKLGHVPKEVLEPRGQRSSPTEGIEESALAAQHGPQDGSRQAGQ